MNDHNTYCVVEKPEADRVGWSRLSHLVNAKKSCQSFGAPFTAAQESILCPLHHDEAVHCMGCNWLFSIDAANQLSFVGQVLLSGRGGGSGRLQYRIDETTVGTELGFAPPHRSLVQVYKVSSATLFFPWRTPRLKPYTT
jgi:hypothetical protein